MIVGRYLRSVAVIVGLALALPVATGGSARALPLLPRTVVSPNPTGSSCVATVVGWNSGSSISLVHASVPKTIRMKCYYGGSESYRPAAGMTVVSGACLTDAIGSLAMQMGMSSNHNFTLSMVCQSDRAVGNVSILATAPGYVEVQFDARCSPSGTCNSVGIYRNETRAYMRLPMVVSAATRSVAFGAATTSTAPGAETGFYMWNSDYDAAMPPSRWGPEVVPDVCANLDMFLAEPGRTFKPGEFASVEFLGFDAETFGDFVTLLRARWSPSDPWFTVWEPAGVLNPVPPSDPLLIRNSTTGNRSGVTLEIECTDIEDRVRYLRGDTSSSETPQPTRACAAMVLGWPEEGTYSGGDVLGISAVVSTSAGSDQIEGLVVGGGRFGNEQTDTLTEITPVLSITFLDFDGTPVAFPVGAGAYLARFSFPLDWTTDDGLFLRCEDGSGYLNFQYKAPAPVGKLPLPEGYDDRFEDCLDGVDFGWRPSSWVPAFFRTTGCVAEVLFVPIDSDVEAMTAGAEAASERAPISYVVSVGGEMVGMLSGAPEAVDAGRNGCLTVLGPMEEAGLDEAQVACPSQLDGSRMTTARSVMGAGAWVAIGLSFFGATRKLIK